MCISRHPVCTDKEMSMRKMETMVMCCGTSSDKNLPGSSTRRRCRPHAAEGVSWQKHPSLGTVGSVRQTVLREAQSKPRGGCQREDCRTSANGHVSTVDSTIDGHYRNPEWGLVQSVGHRCVLLSVSTMDPDSRGSHVWYI